MTISTLELIESLENESLAISAGHHAFYVSAKKELQKHEREKELQITANTLRRFRDTLISIAKCQGGIGSHQASDALRKAGYCAHAGQTYVSITKQAAKNPGEFTCHKCRAHSVEKLVPFQ